ncbi:MAG: dihydroorotate dehydrogenase [Nitrososphaerota archaeon]
MLNKPCTIDMKVCLKSLHLINPTVLTSGVLGVSYSLMKRVEEAGAGAITTKTITKEPREGYWNPVFVDLGYGYVNAIGLRNPGVDVFREEIRRAKKIIRIPIIGSVGGRDLDEFVYVAEEMLEAGCDSLELNLSCPHVSGYGGDIGSDVELTSKIIKEVKSISEKPVSAKLSASHAKKNFIEKYIDAGIDIIAAINTLRAMVVNIDSMTPVLSNIVGGLSGPCIRPIALAVIYDIHREFPDIPLIGVGGVEDWMSAVEMILVGASAVGIGSAIAKKGLSIFKEIVKGLEKYMEEKGFRSVKDLTGYIHRN